LRALGGAAADRATRLRDACFVTPLRLSASRVALRADDPRGFLAAVARLQAILEQPDVAGCGDWARQMLVEDFVPGPEVALEGLVIGGRLNVLALFDKPDPLNGPFLAETIHVAPSRLPKPAQRANPRRARAAVAVWGRG